MGGSNTMEFLKIFQFCGPGSKEICSNPGKARAEEEGDCQWEMQTCGPTALPKGCADAAREWGIAAGALPSPTGFLLLRDPGGYSSLWDSAF